MKVSPYVRERLHFVAFLAAFSASMLGAVYWLMAVVGQFAVMANDVEMEAEPAMMALFGSVVFVAAAPVTLRLAGRWVEVRRVGGEEA